MTGLFPHFLPLFHLFLLHPGVSSEVPLRIWPHFLLLQYIRAKYPTRLPADMLFRPDCDPSVDSIPVIRPVLFQSALYSSIRHGRNLIRFPQDPACAYAAHNFPPYDLQGPQQRLSVQGTSFRKHRFWRNGPSFQGMHGPHQDPSRYYASARLYFLPDRWYKNSKSLSFCC